jgi:hypothetical protein
MKNTYLGSKTFINNIIKCLTMLSLSNGVFGNEPNSFQAYNIILCLPIMGVKMIINVLKVLIFQLVIKTYSS